MALAYSPDSSIDSTRLAFLAAAVVLFAMLGSLPGRIRPGRNLTHRHVHA